VKKKAGKKKAVAKKVVVKKTVAAKKKAAAKKTAVARVSPLRGMSVADWTKKYTRGWQTDAVARLVRVVRAAAPEAVHDIKWGQPIFEQNGPFAFIKPAKAHLSFGFWRGADLEDRTGGKLERGDRMGHIKFRAISDINEAAIFEMVRQAVRLNVELGSPTKR
jgi:hypothetical protein